MVIFLNMDGTGEVVTPERVFQGSDNVTEITAIAPYSADTRLEIGFILPDGLYWTNSDGARYVPMEFAAKDNDKNVTAWSFTLPFSVTEQVGKVKIAINATTTTGNTTSYLCEFTVEESVLPNKPPAPDASVYDYLSLYLSRLDGRTANVPNLVAHIQKAGGNSFTYTDNKGLVSEKITLGEIDYEPTYVGAASVVKIPVDVWQEVYSGQTVTGYTVTVTAAQHGQMQDGVTPNDLWLSFDETENGVISGVYQGYTVNDAGDITLNVTTPVALTVRVWNGKGLKDTIARDAITAETERAEAVETQLQAQIDDIVQSGVDKTAREQIAAETERAEAAERELNAHIDTIKSYISTGTSESNQLVNQAFVNSSINAMAAFYITVNANGDAFPTRESLMNATAYYYGGQERTPTQNDYAIVLADESQPRGVDGNYPTTRYSYQGSEWSFQYVVNNTSLTQAQVNAINSGITKELVDTISKGNVLSVNGQTGAVTITPTNINAVNKSGDEMTGTLKMTGQNYPQIIFKSVSPTANGMQVFFEQQANGQMLIVGRTGETAESNVYIVRVPENDGTIALLDASGNFTAPIVQANNAFLLGENTGSNSQGRIENNPTSKSLDILAPNPTTGAYEVSAKNRGGAYAVFRAKEVYEGTERVYSPNKPNTQLIYDSNTSITVASGGNAIVYNGVIRGVALQNGDLVQIVGYLGDTSATANIVNIMFPIDVNSIGNIQFTNLAYKTTGGYTGRFMVYLETSNRNLVVRFAREFLPDNTVNETPMTVTRVRIRRFSE